MKHTKARAATHTESTNQEIAANLESTALERFTAAQLAEIMALRSLDTRIALALHDLMPAAIKAATDPKPDTKLLRLIVRYSSQVNRRLAAIQRQR
jgi:hypothetical protein